MRIALVPSLWARIPPDHYGGAERRVAFLAEALLRRGHTVTVFGAGGSSTGAELRAITSSDLISLMNAGSAYDCAPYFNAQLADVLSASPDFDIVHFHLGSASIPFHTLTDTPSLHTLHTMLTTDDQWILDRYPSAHVSALSRNQLVPLRTADQERIRVIHNGTDFTRYRIERGPRDHLAFLGRLAQHKGVVQAIQMAKALDWKLVIAGSPMTERERNYFETEVRPLVDGEQIVLAGSVDDKGKNALFARAAALLFPISWEEPFGNVMIEAMACGVPVLATNRGSVPEVVDFGITGYYADTIDELVALAPEAMRLDPAVIRATAKRRFSWLRMGAAFEQTYREILSGTDDPNSTTSG